MHRPVALFLCILFVVAHADYFSTLEEILKSEKAKQGSDLLHSEFASDRPKEVEIVCTETPQVLIRDMIDASDNSEECMVLKVSGPKFNFRFAVNCDEDNEAADVDGEDDEEEEEEEEEDIKSGERGTRTQQEAHRAQQRASPKPTPKARDNAPKAPME